MRDAEQRSQDVGPRTANVRRGARYVAALAAGGALVGCSSSAATDRTAAPAAAEASPSPSVEQPVADTHWLTDGSAADEYRTTVAQIEQPLPKGRAYPPGLPVDFVPAPGAGMLEAGAARSQAWFTWLCAWEGDYLAATDSGDEVRTARAAAMVAWWPTGPFYTGFVSDPDRGWVTNVVQPLRAGDSSGVSNDYQHTCSSFPTVDATA